MPTSAVHGNLTSTLRKIGTLPASAAVFYAALNIVLSITAFLGSALILTALRKVSSVRPPTKLLFKCLAITDLLVGLITQPFFSRTSVERCSEGALASSPVTECHQSCTLRSIDLHIDRHKCGQTSRPVTGTTIQRLSVTLKRVRVAIICFWLTGVSAALLYVLLGYLIGMGIALVFGFLCAVISIFSYTKIFLKLRNHQAQVCENYAHQGQTSGRGIPLNIARYKKTVSSIAWVQFILGVCYLPFIISCIIGPDQ